MNKSYQNLLVISLILVVIIVLNSCYITKQGYHQLKLMNDIKPFSETLSDPNIPKKIKDKIRLVQKVKRFAIKELNLNNSNSYTNFAYIKGRFVAYNLTVAHKDKLKPIIWRFPVIGKVPYLGFFDRDDAIHTEIMYKKRGFDTRIRGVSAYSTLGFFSDPLFSTMTRYPESALINVVIHEMVHETIFIKNHVKFNEALATFIGNKGTILFLEKYYGEHSKLIGYVRKRNNDAMIFSSFIKGLVKELNQFYNSSISRKEKISKRKNIYKKYQSIFKKEILPKLKTKAYTNFHKVKLDNTVILYFGRYYHNLSLFNELYLYFNKDLKNTILFLKKLEEIKVNPKKLILLWLNAQKNNKQ